MAGVLTWPWSPCYAAVFGWGAYRDYWWDVLPRVAKFRGYWPNASLVGFWIKLFDPLADGDGDEPLFAAPRSPVRNPRSCTWSW